ncbi:MAG TPA: UPF0182 family protein [Acidimicrobiales bacterium]|nr:UPF0182 family protein [Acidimicrobiales bacterium]
MPADLPRRRRRPDVGSRGRITLVILAFALFVLLTSLRGIAGFYTDLLWFDSLGFRGVFTGVLGAKITLAVIFSLAFFVLLWLNLLIADRLAPRFRPAGPEEEVIERYHELIGNRTGLVRLAIALVFGFIAGVGQAGQWHDWILFRNGQDFGTVDEQFKMDVGFYVFKLPFLTSVVGWLFASLIIILLVTAVAHYVNGGIRVQGAAQRVTPQVKAHLSVLLGMLAAVRAVSYYLQRYELNFSTRGAVDGATYTDVKAQLPALNLLIFISGVAVVLFIVNIWRRGWVLPVLAVGLWAFVALVVGGIYPAFVQRVRVTPAESSKERPYIVRNIEATREALGLEDVESTPFAANGDLSAADLEANSVTVRNIRLWDPSTIQKAYQQLQEVRRNYRFNDVDVDRYEIDGETTQVLVSPRELDQGDLPQSSWEASHLTYTNGHGIVAAASNAKDNNGRPIFISQDVPMVSDAPALEVDQPAIYVGENLDGYVIVNSNRPEFAYQDENETVFTSYEGEDGIGIGSILRRAAFALRFGDVNPLISGNIRPSSKILIVRDVRERVELVAPFLHFDSDPYVVAIDGRLQYVVDAYTTTSRYPYAQRVNTDDQRAGSGLDHRFNYVRNSVKAVVDAYDGSVTLYVVDDSDPLIRAYRQAFPDMFTDDDEIPEALEEHFRYPEDLFRAQTSMWGRYHIEDPDDFYNGADQWDVALEPGTGDAGGTATTAVGASAPRAQRMEPYYLQMRLPGEEKEEFLILRPFAPVARGNEGRQLMTAFMVAKSDPGEYGKLETFVMPRGNLPDGPGIVAATMSSDPAVSELETLLGIAGGGSDIIFGNLILVPIEQSLLFVRPVYVESESTRIPELERVIVSFQGEVALESTLQAGLAKLFGDAPETLEEEGPTGGEEPSDELTVEELLAQAAAAFDEAQAALDEGDLGTYQEKVDEARGYINQARELTGGNDTPSSTTTTTEPAD